MQAFQWARLKENVKTPLRRGAWYRILKLTSSEATVDVRGKPVSLPRGELQLSPGGAAVVADTGAALDRRAGAQERATLPGDVGPAVRRVSQLPGPRATRRRGAEHAVPPLQRIV